VPADADDNNRVFYSTTEKTSSHHIGVEAAKLTRHQIPQARASSGRARTPGTQDSWRWS
jgi:hypothetical protein